MKKGSFAVLSEGDKGLTLLEVLLSFIIFVVIIVSSVILIKTTLINLRKKNLEKEIFSDAIQTLEVIERHLSCAIINETIGSYRMNFIGAPNYIKFIAPFPDDTKSDLGKFGFYLDENKIKMFFERVDKQEDDFTFPKGFPGAQVLGTSVENMKFSYFDGKEWKDEWNTDTGGEEVLPYFVKVEITVLSPEKIEGKETKQIFSKLIKLENR